MTDAFEEPDIVNEMNRPDAWLACTLAGLRAVEEARIDEAASFWRDSCAFADHLSDEDPRRAAARSNLGLGELIAGRHTQAIAALSAARTQWRNVEAWIQRVDIPSTASSSMFHFLLAANHPDVLTGLRRKKYLTLCAGAAALTDSIYDQVCADSAEPDHALLRAQTIQAAFGEDATGTRVLVDLTGGSLPARRVRIVKSTEAQWRSVAKNTVVEMRPLIDAAYLTVGLKPDGDDGARAHRD